MSLKDENAELRALNDELREQFAELKETLKVEHRNYRKRKANSETLGRRRSKAHNEKVIAAAEKRKSEEGRWLVKFQESVDSKTPCHPHFDANQQVGWSSTDFIKRLTRKKAFLDEYSSILTDPPLKKLNGMWVISLDAALHSQKEGKPGPITALLKSTDERFKPDRSGRPTKPGSNGGRGLAPAADEEAINRMYQEMMS